MAAELRVLAADDSPANRLIVQAMLERVGVETLVAANGAEAVEAAARLAFNVILLDLYMPALDGIAAARAIRASPGPNRHTPILAFTAEAAPAQIEACLAAGMNGHIAKPVDPAALLAAITRALAPVTQSGQGETQTQAG